MANSSSAQWFSDGFVQSTAVGGRLEPPAAQTHWLGKEQRRYWAKFLLVWSFFFWSVFVSPSVDQKKVLMSSPRQEASFLNEPSTAFWAPGGAVLPPWGPESPSPCTDSVKATGFKASIKIGAFSPVSKVRWQKTPENTNRHGMRGKTAWWHIVENV